MTLTTILFLLIALPNCTYLGHASPSASLPGLPPGFEALFVSRSHLNASARGGFSLSDHGFLLDNMSNHDFRLTIIDDANVPRIERALGALRAYIGTVI